MASIVLCTHNDSHLMMPALRSCLGQGPNTEVIVVDDASTVPIVDPIMEIIEANDNVVLHRHDKNKGLSAARNTGVCVASQDRIIALDSDDYLFDNVLGRLEAAIDEGADVAYGNLWIEGHIDYPMAQPWDAELLKRYNPIFCSSMFTRDIWERAGGYVEREGPHYEDWGFWNKCWMHGAKFAYVDVLVYEHIERKDSMLRVLEQDRDKYVRIATECLE